MQEEICWCRKKIPLFHPNNTVPSYLHSLTITATHTISPSPASFPPLWHLHISKLLRNFSLLHLALTFWYAFFLELGFRFDFFGSVWQIEKIDLCKFGSELCLSCFILCFVNFGNFVATVCFYSIHSGFCFCIVEFRVRFGDFVCYLL